MALDLALVKLALAIVDIVFQNKHFDLKCNELT